MCGENLTVCALDVGRIDPTAIVSFAALACTILVWVGLIIATALYRGGRGWIKGVVYYFGYRYNLSLCLLFRLALSLVLLSIC